MKYNSAVITSILSLLIAVVISGCSPASIPQDETNHDGKITVVTTLFPLYDFAKTLLGDKGDVSLLLPPGVEAHAYEPTPRDIVRISKADVFIYTGEFMEPWVKDILTSVTNKNLMVIDASKDIDLFVEDTDEHADEDADEHTGSDPHIWLDPTLASQMAKTIADGLSSKSPEYGKHIHDRLEVLRADLAELDQLYTTTLEQLPNKTLVYGGHFAFGYMARRYGLKHISPYEGFAPNAEPTPLKIAQLVETLKASGSNYVFYQELIDPRVAQVLSDETGAKMLMLHGAHNVSKDDLAKGITYIDIMKQNLTNLAEGLRTYE